MTHHFLGVHPSFVDWELRADTSADRLIKKKNCTFKTGGYSTLQDLVEMENVSSVADSRRPPILLARFPVRIFPLLTEWGGCTLLSVTEEKR
jgi:hypothetical protein